MAEGHVSLDQSAGPQAGFQVAVLRQESEEEWRLVAVLVEVAAAVAARLQWVKERLPYPEETPQG